MFFFVAFISIISNAENIYGEHSWYSYDVPEHGLCTGFADLPYTSPCSEHWPSLGPQNPQTHCAHDYVARTCEHCLECIDPDSVTEEPTIATLEPTIATLEPTIATLEPTIATLEPTLATLEPTLATLEPTLATLEPTLSTLEPTAITTLASLIEDDDGLLVVNAQTAPPAAAVGGSDSGAISVSTELLLGFVFVSFWLLCCGGFWLYYKSTSVTQEKTVEKYKEYIPERKITGHSVNEPIQKITIDMESEYAIAEPGCSVINMDELAAEGSTSPGGYTPGEENLTPGEGYAVTDSRSQEHSGPFLNTAAAMDRSRTNTKQTVSTLASMGTVPDSYFHDSEDTSMDLYENTFETLEREGPVPSGAKKRQPRISEGVVTGFDAQNMMRNNVVEKVFDEFDLEFDAAVKNAGQQLDALALDPQLSSIQSFCPEDDAMDNAVRIPIAGFSESLGATIDLYSDV